MRRSKKVPSLSSPSSENARVEAALEKVVSADLNMDKEEAKRGVPDAMLRLAIFLKCGYRGVERNVAAALTLYRQSAKLGNVDAMMILATRERR